MSKTRALILGVLGQDGCLLAHHLRSQGYEVHGWVRPGAPQALNHDPEKRRLLEGCAFTELDTTNRAQVRAELARISPHQFYHLAACHHSSESNLQQQQCFNEQMFEVNFLLTRDLVGFLSEDLPHCRFLFAGSSQMFKADSTELPVTERTPHHPATYYGLTKAMSRDLIRFHREKYGFWGGTAILFNHESRLRKNIFVSRKITEAVARMKLGLQQEIEVHDFTSRVDWSSAEDFVEAMHLMMEAPAGPMDCVLASGQLYQVSDLLEAAFSSVGLDWRAHSKSRVSPSSVPTGALWGDPSLAKEKLGWKLKIPFQQLIASMVRHDLEHLESKAT